MLPSAVAQLMPTPTAVRYGNNQLPSPGAAVRPSLDSLAQTLLPTPRASDTGTPGRRASDGFRPPLSQVVLPLNTSVDWGPFTAAIARWESVLGRPAPDPRDEKGRLAPRFVEFLMGLDEGWVSDVPGLSRNELLRLLGNGVVPQQCAAALPGLLAARTAALASTERAA
jgi:DNA (cytosine-5)-methyltransferase 1